MRARTALVTFALALLGCTGSSGPASAPEPAEGPHAVAIVSTATPATIVYTSIGVPDGDPAGSSGVRSHVAAIPEDGSRPAVMLSPAGVDAKFVATLPGSRVLFSTLRADGTVATLASAALDGSDLHTLGTFDARPYAYAHAHPASSGVVVEMLRKQDLGTADVYALADGRAPVLLAEKASFVAESQGRVALLVGADARQGTGDLVVVGLDGAGKQGVGGGDGEDVVGSVSGARIVVTSHAAAAGDVRVVDLASGMATTFGSPVADERAFGLAGGRVVFTRTTRGPIALASASLDGADDHVLAAPKTGAEPLAIAHDELVLFGDGSALGGLFAVPVSGGATRTIDADAGTRIHVFGTVGDRVVYTAARPSGWTLRSAKLDGSGATVLYEKPFMLPFVVATTGDRVVFRASPSMTMEGGQLASVRLDGGDLRSIGYDVYGADGARREALPSDQDFFAVTPSGRVILEVEYEGSTFGSQIVASAPRLASARELSELGRVWFGAVVP